VCATTMTGFVFFCVRSGVRRVSGDGRRQSRAMPPKGATTTTTTTTTSGEGGGAAADDDGEYPGVPGVPRAEVDAFLEDLDSFQPIVRAMRCDAMRCDATGCDGCDVFLFLSMCVCVCVCVWCVLTSVVCVVVVRRRTDSRRVDESLLEERGNRRAGYAGDAFDFLGDAEIRATGGR